MTGSASPWGNALLLLCPLVLLAAFIAYCWHRDEQSARREAMARATQTDTRYRFAPPISLRAFSEDEAQRRRLNLETLRLTFRASLQEEVEADLRGAIERGTFAPPTFNRVLSETAESAEPARVESDVPPK